MIAVMIGFLPGIRKQRFVKPAVVAIIGTAFVRGMMLSERLALIELVVCLAVVFLRTDILGKVKQIDLQRAFRVAPVVGVLVLLVLFGSFEYYRSYRFYQKRFNNIAEFTVWRISAYYTLPGYYGGGLSAQSQPPRSPT